MTEDRKERGLHLASSIRDNVALPSRREAFGLVLLEAGVAGKAVVASAVGGIPETIIDGETGILVPAERADSLAGAILKMLSNPSETAEMGRKAREHVLRNFRPEDFRDRFLNLYAGLIDSSAPRYEGRAHPSITGADDTQ